MMYKYSKDLNITSTENISVIEYLDREDEYKPHTHEFIEFVYIKSGSATHKIDDKEYKLSYGDMVVIDYGQVHSFVPTPKVDYVNILLNPEFFSDELVDIDSISQLLVYDMFEEFFEIKPQNKQCIRFGEKYRAEVDFLIDQMITEFANKKMGYRSVLKGSMRILLSWILRESNFRENTGVIDDVMEYINANFSNKIDLHEMAARYFYNPSYFSRLIKEKIGKSFSSYVKEKRIMNAKELLIDTNQKIDDVIYSVGYKDKKLFYKHFEEFFGMSPGKYRKENRK